MKRLLPYLAFALIGIPASAHADEPKTPITKPVELRHDLKIEWPVLGALAAVTIGFRLVRDDLEPSHCRICDPATPGKVNAVDDWFRTAFKARDTQPAQVTSYILGFGVAPVSAVVMTVAAAVADNRGDEAVADVVAVAEGGFASMLTTEVLESLTLRERPLVHAVADPAAKQREIDKTGAYHSFPAGHVVETMGTATAAGVVASLRHYRLAPVVWLVGMGIAVATAYTRIAADEHYFTDTLAGAAIGAVVGGGVPLLFHRPRPYMPALMATPQLGGMTLSAGWTL